jgi:group I intron endonuclease
MADVIVAGGGIYAIRHIKNGKCYVGSAVSFKVRWKGHRTNLRAGKHHSQKLQRAWEKHGQEMFEFVVLEHINDPATLLEREQHWMDSLNAHRGGYNVSPVAGSVLGIKHSDAMKEKMREIRAANPITPEQHAKMAEARRNSEKFMSHVQQLGLSGKGRTHSDEAKAKIAEASRRMMADPERREAVKKSSTGRRHTPDAIEKMRKAPRRKGWKHTPEALEQIRQAGIGRVISPETVEKRRVTRRINAEKKREANL